jgi:hypothetical protein
VVVSRRTVIKAWPRSANPMNMANRIGQARPNSIAGDPRRQRSGSHPGGSRRTVLAPRQDLEGGTGRQHPDGAVAVAV